MARPCASRSKNPKKSVSLHISSRENRPDSKFCCTEYARKGLCGLIAIGCGKMGMPGCRDQAYDSDLEDNVYDE